jgi:hypothetical protein
MKDMQLPLLRSAVAILVFLCFLIAQQAPEASQDATIPALLKEVHALRLALEQSNQFGPRVQIVLGRMQQHEARLISANRQVQEAREKTAEFQTMRAANLERLKQFEAQQAQTIDSGSRKQMDADLAEAKAAIDRLSVLEQQYRSREAEAQSLLLKEQDRWNEANEILTSIERALPPLPR